MAKSRQAGNVKTKMVTLIYGAPFTGKTTLALQMAYFKREDNKPFRVLVIDGENGGVDEVIDELISNGVEPDNIFIVYTQSLQEAEAIISKIKTHEPFYHFDENGNESDEVVLDADGTQFYPDGLVVDGTSVFKMTSEQGLLELSKKRNTVKANKNQLVGVERTVAIQNADLEFKDYKKLNFAGQNFVLDLMACGVHVVITAREKDETISREINGTKETINTGKKIYDGFKGLDYNVKTHIHMFKDDDSGMICAEILKDRTKVHKDGEIIEDPTLLDWQQVVDKCKNRKEFILKNDLNNAVETEYKMWEKESMDTLESSDSKANNTESVISLDDIKSKIAAIQKSLSPVDKTKAKTALSEKNLPIAIKSVTDIDVLNKIYEVLSEFKK